MTRYRQSYLLAPDGTTVVYSMQRWWEIQSKPYRAPLSFAYERVDCSGVFTNNAGDVGYYGTNRVDLGGSGRDHSARAANQAYDKFVGQLGSSSQMANNLLEAHQSVGMIVSRAQQIASFAVNLRKGNFGKAARALGTPNPRGGKKGLKPTSKDFGDQFLEYHFGWEPLIQDMHNAAQTLSKTDFGSHRVVSKGSCTDKYVDRSEQHSFGVTYTSVRTRTVQYRARYGAVIQVNNPNAYLANQYGLINPLSIAWEAVPFSFVADWFGNIGQCLSAMTDFVGMDVSLAYNTLSEEITIGGWDQSSYPGGPAVYNGFGTLTGHKISVSRGPGIPGPTLSLKPFNGLSVTRAATAISLLLQQLK